MRSNRKSEDVAKLVHMDKLFAIVFHDDFMMSQPEKQMGYFWLCIKMPSERE
jgi:hypothetical protein